MSGIQAPWIGYCKEEYDEICGYDDEEARTAYLADYRCRPCCGSLRRGAGR